MERETTATHEAGHVVAHVRLGIAMGAATIRPTPQYEGAVSGEGADHVHDSDQAQGMVLAYCAGYAALIAAGRSAEVASSGCGSDFELAEHLISFWNLEGDLEEWKRRAVTLMAEPENVRAVELLAEELLALERIDGDHLAVIVEVADGVASREDYDRYLASRSRNFLCYSLASQPAVGLGSVGVR